MKQYLVLLFSLLCMQASIAQNYLAKNEYFHHLTNGLSVMLIKDPGASNLAVNLTFRTGAFTEVDTANGINYLYAQYMLLKNEKAPTGVNDVAFLKSNKIDVNRNVGLEEVSFQFLLQARQLEDLLNFLLQTLSTHPDTLPFIEIAQAQNNADFYTYEHDMLYSSQQKISKNLWEEYWSRMQVITLLDSSATNLEDKLKTVEDCYYCPGNALLVIKGDIDVRKTKTLIQMVLLNWDKCRFNHLFRYSIPSQNYFTYSRQMVFEVPVDTPFFTFTYQAPSYFSDTRGLTTALLFEQILADTSSQLYRYLVDSTYIKQIEFETDIAYYANEATFTIVPDSAEKLDSARLQWYQLLNDNQLASLISKEDIQKASLQMEQAFKLKKQQPLEAVSLFSKYWASGSIDYYSLFPDSLMSLNQSDLSKFSQYYFSKTPHIASLFINSEMRDSLSTNDYFIPTGGYVEEYQFQFLKNTADFTDASQDSVIESLAQYLKINPRVKVKVTGQVSKNELMQVRDTDMQSYLDSMEYLQVFPKSTIKGPKIRLDMYRALTIIKKLDEAGVPRDQLFGQGVVAKKPKEMETAQTAYCTLLRTIQLRED